MTTLYSDRIDAGRLLADRLSAYGGRRDVIVLALPRGGVPVAYEVAKALGAPLDVFLVRKLGVPGHEELAMGAIASGGIRLLNPLVVNALEITEDAIERVTVEEQRELERRERAYHGDRPAPDLRGQIVILVDDGLATGSSMRSAVAAVRQQGPKSIVVAVPVASATTCDELGDEVDAIVCGRTPEPFYSVGHWYEDFSQTTDEEVSALLAQARDEANVANRERRR